MELGDDDSGGVFADLSLDESRAMSGLTSDQWYSMPRPERANKVARLIAERRISLYQSLQTSLEIKNRRNE